MWNKKTVVRTASLDGGVCCGMENYCVHCITWWWCVMWNKKLLCALHHLMVVCVAEWRTTVRTASRDGGVWCGIKNCCAHCITWWWCVMWNKKLLCAMHHVMVVFVVESKTTVHTASRDGVVCCVIQNCCAHCITWWWCVLWNEELHHVMVVCVLESKTTVRTPSLDGCVCCGMKNYCAHCITWWWCVMWNKKLLCALRHLMVVCVVEWRTTVCTASLDGGVCCGMKNFCAHCITWWWCVMWNKKCCAHCITWWWCVMWNKKLLCALHHVIVVCVVESKTTVRTASRDVNFTISPKYFAIYFYINHIVLT